MMNMKINTLLTTLRVFYKTEDDENNNDGDDTDDGDEELIITVSTTPRVFCQAEISFRKNPMYLLVIMFCSWTWGRLGFQTKLFEDRSWQS